MLTMLSNRFFWLIQSLLLLILCALITSGTRQEAEELLSQVPLIDGHNDLAWNIRRLLRNQINDFNFDSDLTLEEPWSKSLYSHTDLPRLRSGKMGAQFWSAYVPCSAQNKDAVQLTFEQIDVIKRLVSQYPDSMLFATSVSDILQAHEAKPKKVASLIGIEGGHSIGNSLGILRMFYDVGVRYLSLTHNCNTLWADSSSDKETLGGLNDFGEKVVREMNRLGMLIDLSHVSSNTSRAVIKLSKAPVIFSHSSVYSICPNARNVPDDIIQTVKDTGGIIMVNFYPNFIKCSNNATLKDVVEHLTYIKNKIGSDYVGLGGDYDGVNRLPKGLEDVDKYPEIFSVLIENGEWSTQDLKNLAGHNLLRVLKKVEEVRDELKTANIKPEEDPNLFDGGNCTSNAFFSRI